MRWILENLHKKRKADYRMFMGYIGDIVLDCLTLNVMCIHCIGLIDLTGIKR